MVTLYHPKNGDPLPSSGNLSPKNGDPLPSPKNGDPSKNDDPLPNHVWTHVTTWLVSTSQSLQVLSPEAVSICLLSGANESLKRREGGRGERGGGRREGKKGGREGERKEGKERGREGEGKEGKKGGREGGREEKEREREGERKEGEEGEKKGEGKRVQQHRKTKYRKEISYCVNSSFVCLVSAE